MSLFDGFPKLQSLFHANLSALKKIEFSTVINLQIGNNNTGPQIKKLSIDDHRKRITLHPDALDHAELKELKQFLKQEVEEKDTLLLEKKTSSLFQEVSKFSEDESQQELVTLFSGILPATDLLALEASLFLRKRKHAGEDINRDLSDLVRRFGMRGKTISNLCSAGYFEDYIQPMYKQMALEPHFEKRDFLENWEVIVEDTPFAAFIPAHLSSSETYATIKSKIERSRKYGFYWVNIHGLGYENVLKIEAAIDMLVKEFRFQKSGKFGRSYIRVRLDLEQPIR